MSVGYTLRDISLPGLHSYAIASLGDTLIIVGGRKDGLHLRQPSFAFDSLSRNDSLWVYEKETDKTIALSLDMLAPDIAAQLSSSNPLFVHHGAYLYIVGGYGYDPKSQSHITFARLTALHIPSILSHAYTDRILDSTCYFSIKDDVFAVTGGVMHRYDDHYILACGQRFDGLYNPVDNPTFTQVYHTKIVELDIDPQTQSYTILNELQDSTLRRRDLSSSIVSGPRGDRLILYAGVFRKDINFPYQNILEYTGGELRSVDKFRQCLSTYHTAHSTLDLSSIDDELRETSIFVGGLAPYYFEDTSLFYDTDVPFTQHISLLTRDAQGRYTEYLSKTQLPAYIGTGAYMIKPKNKPPHANNKSSIGYFIGGIRSPEHNVFWSDSDSPSVASTKMVELYIEPCPNGWTEMKYSNSPYQIDLFPDKDYTHFTAHWKQGSEKVLIEIYNSEGYRLFSQNYSSDRAISQKLELPKSIMAETHFQLHFKGKEEYWIEILNND